MQRPILATVYGNPQMRELLRRQGHFAVETMSAGTGKSLNLALMQMVACWKRAGLADNGSSSSYTTQAAVIQLLSGLVPKTTE
jgi:hypothetical protein